MSHHYYKLSDIKDLYQSIFYLQDPMILDVILSVALATKLQGDPIWLLIIGGSSSGKSELINILNKVPFVHPVSSLSENTFLSNMRSTNGKEASLLHRIGNNGMITMKDYTSILSMRSEKRDLIISQMREIFDGKLDKEAGNGNPQHWEGKINWIGAVTDSIYIAEGESAGMGRRTINYVMPLQDRKITTRQARKNTADIEEKRKLIQTAVAEFVEYKLGTLSKTLPELSEEVEEDLVLLSDFITIARTPTERDYRGVLKLTPAPEMPMRVFAMLQKLAQTMLHISDSEEGIPPTWEDKHWITMGNLAFNSIQKQRWLILKTLASFPSVTKKGAGIHLNYPTDTVGEWLEDVNVLGLCERAPGKDGKSDLWTLKNEYREIMRKYAGVEVEKGNLIDEDSESGAYTINPTWVVGPGESDDKAEARELKENAQRDFFNNFMEDKKDEK